MNSVDILDCGIPITFSSLVLEITSRCNAKCSMCYQAAGPKGSDTIGDHTLSSETIYNAVAAATQIPTIGRRLHISGGEALLKPNSVLSLFTYARDLQHFNELSTTTNAYWASTRKRAHQLTEQLASAGLSVMEISWDYWHSPYVSGHAVSNCIDACLATGIEPHLRLLTTRSHSAHEALALLRPESVRKVAMIHSCPVFATGRAATDIPSNDFHQSAEPAMAIDGACHASLNLTINAKGNVFPCCAGADQTEGLAFGNINSAPLNDIVERMQASPLLRVLVFKGVSKFLPLLQSAGISVKNDYKNMCEFCYDVFSRPEAVATIKSHFDNATTTAMEIAIERWKRSVEHEQIVFNS